MEDWGRHCCTQDLYEYLQEERVQDWWREISNIIRNVAREVLGVTSGKPRSDREE